MWVLFEWGGFGTGPERLVWFIFPPLGFGFIYSQWKRERGFNIETFVSSFFFFSLMCIGNQEGKERKGPVFVEDGSRYIGSLVSFFFYLPKFPSSSSSRIHTHTHSLRYKKRAFISFCLFFTLSFPKASGRAKKPPWWLTLFIHFYFDSTLVKKAAGVQLLLIQSIKGVMVGGLWPIFIFSFLFSSSACAME